MSLIAASVIHHHRDWFSEDFRVRFALAGCAAERSILRGPMGRLALKGKNGIIANVVFFPFIVVLGAVAILMRLAHGLLSLILAIERRVGLVSDSPAAKPPGADAGVFWCPTVASPLYLEIWRSGRFARLPCDPTRPELVAPQLFRGWCIPVSKEVPGPAWRRGDDLSWAEFDALLREAISFVATERGAAAVIALLSDQDGLEQVTAWCAGNQQLHGGTQAMTRLGWSRMQMKRPAALIAFGSDLMRAVAARLLREGEKGGLREYHKEYCGHGLFHDGQKYCLATLEDGYPSEVLQTWATTEDFVAFFATQTDYSCSGADETSPIFAADDPWLIGNQRLERTRLDEYVRHG